MLVQPVARMFSTSSIYLSIYIYVCVSVCMCIIYIIYIYTTALTMIGEVTKARRGFGDHPIPDGFFQDFSTHQRVFFHHWHLGTSNGWYTQLGFSNHHSWYLITILWTSWIRRNCVRSTAPQWAAFLASTLAEKQAFGSLSILNSQCVPLLWPRSRAKRC